MRELGRVGLKPIKSDFLVIGSGIAGLSFALKAADYGSVIIITKKSDHDSNTNHAQGGIAAVTSGEDNFKLHYSDTMTAGAGLCHPDAVDVLVKEGPERILELIEWGVRFSKDQDQFDLAKEGGHSRHRILHASDMTGAEIEHALLTQVKKHPNINLYENHFAIDLITEHHVLGNLRSDFNICFGAYILNEISGEVNAFQAKITVLATGGASRVYRHTTNPAISTGDGIAMAHRAHARVANMEFIQFHPTAVYHPDGEPFLISEALRGYGGRLKTLDGKRFMPEFDERAELAPRDIVARAIDQMMKQSGDKYVLLDMTHLDHDKVRERFPNIFNYCMSELKIDMTSEPIPVVPAAHYVCGGVMTDLEGRTSLRNLYAIGETAHTGVHGANRLASNSLLEAVVFSHRAWKSSLTVLSSDYSHIRVPGWDDTDTANHEEWLLIRHNLEELQMVMWDYVGIIRSKQHLERALRRVNLLSQEIEDYYRRTKVTSGLLELRNLTGVANLIIRAALHRNESRGLHTMSDYPQISDNFLRDTIL